eukprot:355489-Chlamydomonas_euryale.AAC.7
MTLACELGIGAGRAAGGRKFLMRRSAPPHAGGAAQQLWKGRLLMGGVCHPPLPSNVTGPS